MKKPIETVIINDERFKKHIAKNDGGSRIASNANRFHAKKTGITSIRIDYYEDSDKEVKQKVHFFDEEV